MIRTLTAFTLVLTLFGGSFTTLEAAEDQFNINLSVTAGADVISPSVPNGLSATALSASQIDLVWNASTDNVGVTGYRIYRDAILIGTSVATSYSDIGLNSSTLYSYTVSAIDAALNESVQSASASATTFASPLPTGPVSGGGQSQTRVPQITDLVVTPNQTGAIVTYTTSIPTVGTLAWGLTENYELGTVAGTILSTSHTVTLVGLISGTEYSFAVTVVSGNGVSNSSGNLKFRTLPIAEGNVNARNFTATPYENQIFLKWSNPQVPNFREVRVVRAKNFFPNDPSDGQVVYEGPEESFVDSDVEPGVRYYYTLFTQDTSLSYSSGIIAEARIGIPGEPSEVDGGTLPNLPDAENVHPIISGLQFLDFDFIQSGKKIIGNQTTGTLEIDGGKNLTVSLDYNKVPEVLKSIAVTLSHPSDPSKTFSFLLRVNPEKTLYTATIGELGDSGTYGVQIIIIDYKNQGLKKISGSLLASSNQSKSSNGFIESSIILIEHYFFYFLLLIILLSTLWVLAKQNKKQTQ